MNKQQLAARIWASAQKMRSSKIEAQQYKDYLLGFIFYKFLSSNEINVFKKLLKGDITDDSLKMLDESNKELVGYLEDEIGYFIPYQHLYSTWLSMGSEFSVKNVTDALSSFSRHISHTYSHVFKDIFRALEGGFSGFGETTGSMTKAISDLLSVIHDIPTDGQQGYDVLGFIYEYLISNFAASAGKKAGEYYTPHEVSVLMSEIVAEHLKDRDTISIYDPTSGSGSLLLTIGRAVGRHIEGKNRVDYYAQELVESTFNLTRMNLVMRQEPPSKIHVSNADTLARDWPIEETGKPLRVDAVVSNPPYSQGWNPASMKLNPRFTYGLAPKGKADYAFLLHSLFHLDTDGIMTIVLPTGVLSRGEEYQIRKNLIEHEHIKAVIALPPNIFYGTNIPTIIMVLCQQRRKGEAGDVLFVNATDCCIKQGKKNVLRASDIRRIADVVRDRQTIPRFSYLATKKEVAEKNDYNLHIPRYVNTATETVAEDLHAHIFGGIPDAELNELNNYWTAFPSLRSSLFAHHDDTPYSQPATADVAASIWKNMDVAAFRNQCADAMNGLDSQLEDTLIKQMKTINPDVELTRLTADLFKRTSSLPLIDRYAAYQTFSDHWMTIATDVEMIQTEGFDTTRKVDPITEYVTDKRGIEEEKTRGWQGRVIPFDLVQNTLLKEEADALSLNQRHLENISSEYAEMRELLSVDEQERYLTEDRENFDFNQIDIDYRQALADIDTPEIRILKAYLGLIENYASKAEKQAFVQEHPDFNWGQMRQGRDGTYSKTEARAYLFRLQNSYTFDKDTTEGHLQRINAIISEEKSLQSDIRFQQRELDRHTIETIHHLTDEQVLMLLRLKWIVPLCNELIAMPESIIQTLTEKVALLESKYADTLHQINAEINEAESHLADMLGRLRGSDEDMTAIAELQQMMRGDRTGESAKILKEVCSLLMIPQRDGKVPQVRFEGYEGEWEEKSGAVLFIPSNERNHPELPVLSATQDKGMVIRDEIGFKVSHDKDNEIGYKRVIPGDFVIHLRSFQGGFAHSSFEGIASPAYTIFKLRNKNSHDDYFWKFVFTSKSFINRLQLITYGIRDGRNIRYDEFEKMLNVFPKQPEQHDIAEFFMTLDRLIALRSRQLEKLKALKSGFLQKMFV